MDNGFQTSVPASRLGDSYYNGNSGYPLCQRFLVPGSGTLNVTRIGLWSQSSDNHLFKLAIFEDYSSTQPGAIVSNSDSGAITATNTTYSDHYATYSTAPTVTAGSYYWLAATVHTTNPTYFQYSASTPGGGRYGDYSKTYYPNWPTDVPWSTHTWNYDTGIYAIVEAAGGGQPTMKRWGGVPGMNLNKGVW